MTEHQVNVNTGAALRSARESRRVSLRWLAGRLGVSPATLSAQETGRTPLTVPRLAHAADILDVPLARLVTGRIRQSDRAPLPAGHHVEWRDYPPLELGPILSAAMRVFVEKGFHAATVRDVAAVAGLSVAGIYHHHPSKADLLIDLFDAAMSEIRWRVVAARDDTDGDVEKFAAMVESLALFHASRGDLAFLGWSEMRGLPASERSRFTDLRSSVQYLLEAQALLALRAGGRGESGAAVPDVDDLHTTTRAIATMCTSLPAWFRLDGGVSAPEVARKYADLAIGMLEMTRSSTSVPH